MHMPSTRLHFWRRDSGAGGDTQQHTSYGEELPDANISEQGIFDLNIGERDEVRRAKREHVTGMGIGRKG